MIAATVGVVLAGVLFCIFLVLRGIPARLSEVAKAIRSGPSQPQNNELITAHAALEVLVAGLKRDVDRLPTIWREERERMDRAAQRTRVAADRLEARQGGERTDIDPDPGDDAPLESGVPLQPMRSGVAPQSAQDRQAEVRRTLIMQRLGRRA